MIKLRFSRSHAVGLLMLMALGCSKVGGSGSGKTDGPANQAEREATADLKLFTLAYRISCNLDRSPPMKWEDLQRRMSVDRPVHFERYVVVWGFDPTLDETANWVLAYEVDAPAKGGMVGFVDGSIRKVSAAEFRRLPIASPSPLMADRPAAVSLTPAEYYAQFNKLGKQGQSMSSKYGNKVIELKGIVKGIRRHGDETELMVATPGNDIESVDCFVASSEEPWARLSKGQQVAVKGIVRDDYASPALVNCAYSATGPSEAVIATAEELSKEAAVDREKTEKKYKNKSFILTGEIVRVEKPFLSLRVSLKGTDNRELVCRFSSDGSTKERDKKLVPGAKIKVYGEFPSITSFNSEIYDCELITGFEK